MNRFTQIAYPASLGSKQFGYDQYGRLLWKKDGNGAVKVRAEMSKLYKLYMDGGLTSKRFAEYNRPLEERLAQMDEGIPELEAEIDFLRFSIYRPTRSA